MQPVNGLILQRAKAIGSIIRSMSASLVSEIRAFFAPSTLPDLVESNKARYRTLGVKPGITTTLWNGLAWTDASLLVTLGNQLMAWLTDDVGVYFAPEEVADVFGCFYLTHMELFNVQTGSTVNLDETADRGNLFLALMTADQRAEIVGIANAVTNATANGTLWRMKAVRIALNAELRRLMSTDTVDEALLSSLHYQLGYLDGTIVAALAPAFTRIYWTMSPDQLVKMRALRDPAVPQANCPNSATGGGSWMLASPVAGPVVHEGEPREIWLSGSSAGVTVSSATAPVAPSSVRATLVAASAAASAVSSTFSTASTSSDTSSSSAGTGGEALASADAIGQAMAGVPAGQVRDSACRGWLVCLTQW